MSFSGFRDTFLFRFSAEFFPIFKFSATFFVLSRLSAINLTPPLIVIRIIERMQQSIGLIYFLPEGTIFKWNVKCSGNAHWVSDPVGRKQATTTVQTISALSRTTAWYKRTKWKGGQSSSWRLGKTRSVPFVRPSIHLSCFPLWGDHRRTDGWYTTNPIECRVPGRTLDGHLALDTRWDWWCTKSIVLVSQCYRWNPPRNDNVSHTSDCLMQK